MLKWHKNYYRGTSIKNISKIRLKLIQGKPVPGIYLITLSENPHNQLEILPALTLVQETAARICPEIVGIAKGKEEALELITDMVQTIYEETGELNIKEYWKHRGTHATYSMDITQVYIDPSGNPFRSHTSGSATHSVLSGPLQGFRH